MPLSWNEIRHNAIRFSREWCAATRENAEKQTFWNEFFDVFGLKRRLVASFEEPVKKLSGDYGFIDLFWQGKLLVEHKSLGQDLGKAQTQAHRYIQDLINDGRREEAPRYIIVSDFARIALHDLDEDESLSFPLADFHKYIHAFAFIPGYKQHTFEDQDPINIRAVEIMGKLHDALSDGGYSGHQLERFLVRVLFCLFAEDTGIFDTESFRLYVENGTKEDGSDLGVHLARLFDVLNTPPERRQKNLDETLAAFPYVNGDLFAENLGFADFNRDMRNALLAAGHFDWSAISPAIFGSLFQAIMEPKERRQIGAHYTSERDILKVVRSLFLDDLRAEFDRLRKRGDTGRKARLEEFHHKLCSLQFLDPACGCGNFLVITYREIRQLELELLKEMHGSSTEGGKAFQHEMSLDEINRLSKVDVDQMHGIELLEWPVRIAEVALWLMDHQMNLKVSETFGQLYRRLPLRKRPTIAQNNALRMDWKDILPPEKCSYILGNPPFVGKKEQTDDQKSDMDTLFGQVKGAGVLDYVCSWYVKAAEFIQGTRIRVAFVSTNSITQGEQVGVLWQELLGRFHVKIHFAHRTFPWESEARGKAHVHVVIVGFGAFDLEEKKIFDYDSQNTEPHAFKAKNISPYLADAGDVVLVKRGRPISDAPEISYGSMANDRRKTDKGLGNLILDREAREKILAENSKIEPFIRPFMGSEEFLNDEKRWCLWLVDAPPDLIRSCPLVRARVEAVRAARAESGRPETKRLAATPALFGEIRQPTTPYLLIPKVSSETRRYLPIGFLKPYVIANGSSLVIPGASLYHFGLLSSSMHMAWMRYTCGRLESRYQYSSQIVYNNFPWPKSPTDKQNSAVEEFAQAVLDVRKEYPKSTLADLYDPLSMPPKLVKAHAALDRAVDRCYRADPFPSERHRVEFLFGLYEKLTVPLIDNGSRRKR
jgi:hypothetical protein